MFADEFLPIFVTDKVSQSQLHWFLMVSVNLSPKSRILSTDDMATFGARNQGHMYPKKLSKKVASTYERRFAGKGKQRWRVPGRKSVNLPMLCG